MMVEGPQGNNGILTRKLLKYRGINKVNGIKASSVHLGIAN